MTYLDPLPFSTFMGADNQKAPATWVRELIAHGARILADLEERSILDEDVAVAIAERDPGFLLVAPPERGLVLMTRANDMCMFLATALAGDDVQNVVAALLDEAGKRGGSAHPEDWCAWVTWQPPSVALVCEFEELLDSGAISHPAVLYLIVDSQHPRAPGDA